MRVAYAQQPVPPVRTDTDSVRRAFPDSTRARLKLGDTTRQVSARIAPAASAARDSFPLGLVLNARLETKAERNRNERCAAQQITLYAATCRSPLQPNMDF